MLTGLFSEARSRSFLHTPGPPAQEWAESFHISHERREYCTLLFAYRPISQRHFLNWDSLFSDMSRFLSGSQKPTSTTSMKPPWQTRYLAPICILPFSLSSSGNHLSAFCHCRSHFFFQFWIVSPGLLPLLALSYIPWASTLLVANYSSIITSYLLLHLSFYGYIESFQILTTMNVVPEHIHIRVFVKTYFIRREVSPYGVPTPDAMHMLNFLSKLSPVFPKWLYYSTS